MTTMRGPRQEPAAIDHAIDDLASGRPGVVLVQDAAELGKTRLLGEAATRAVTRAWRSPPVAPTPTTATCHTPRCPRAFWRSGRRW